MFGHRKEALRGQHDMMSGQVGERLADREFRFALRIDVGGVEEVDAEVEGLMQQSRGLRVVDTGTQCQPRAQRYFADLKAASAQRACSHGPESSRPCERREVLSRVLDLSR